MLCDVKCPKCGTVYEDKIIYNVETEEVICEKCNIACEIIPSISATFRLKYDNKKDICSWGAEGYSKSKYWSEQNKLAKKNIFVQPGNKEEGGKVSEK